MFAAAFIGAVAFFASAYLLGPKRLHPFQIAFAWVFVVFVDEIFFTLMLVNWKLFDVSERISDVFVRLVNLDVVTPIVLLVGLEASVRVSRLWVRTVIGIATAAVLIVIDVFLIRSDVIRTEGGFRWMMLYAEEAFLVVCSYIGLFLMSVFMRKDGIGYDPFY